MSHPLPHTREKRSTFNNCWPTSLSSHWIIEGLGWRRPSRSSCPNINLTLSIPPVNHFPKLRVYMSFKYLQGWCLNHFPEQPVLMLYNSFSEEIFPNIQSKPPLVQVIQSSSSLWQTTANREITNSMQHASHCEKLSLWTLIWDKCWKTHVFPYQIGQ